MGTRHERFIRPVTASTLYRADGGVEVSKAPAVWTLAHRGYRGNGKLDVWAYPTKALALREGARLALDCGLDEDPRAVELFETGRYQQVLDAYEARHPDTHLLRVQPAFLQDDLE